MGNLIAKEKTIVVPGEVLADGMDYIPGFNTYREGEKVLACKLGLMQVEGRAIKLIPLSGKYNPKTGDTIIGKVIDVLFSGWRIETNSAYSAMLPLKDATSEFIARGADLTRYYNFGDYVVAKITNVTSQNLVDLTMKGPGLRKLNGGRVIEVSPYKVPRIIGKKGSMVSMIKDATGCRIVVGQNGLVWIQGDNPAKMVVAIKTIRKIEAESHISGLTDVIKVYLENETKGEQK
ncbi:MAG: exosome complex RNA-binding protein Rrp4 [Nanoarchaeota archaeon]|nr:exosome complex RNA-binding protein Rrp4 [Nanoarchaeota archaeon]